MHRVLNILKKILAIFFIFLLHIIITNILPYPFNHISLIYLAIFYLIFLPTQTNNIWLVAPILFLLELFTSTAFGLNFIAYFITLIFMSWLFVNILTSHSLPFLVLYFSIGLIFYRVIFYLLAYFTSYFTVGGAELNIRGVSIDILWETLLTTGIMILYHLLYATFNKKFNPKYLINE